MIESLVQWTFLNNLSNLGLHLDFNIAEVVGQEITTEYGRLDFILSDKDNKHLIVELETILDDKNKIEYCFMQILNYKNINFVENTSYCILYAEETKSHNQQKIKKFAEENNILQFKYSLEKIKKLYAETVERFSLNIGLCLPNPKNYTICFLRWINKILKPFCDLNKQVLSENEIFKPFENKSKSKTNFNCHLRIAFDFELLELENNRYILTEMGKVFTRNISPYAFKTDNVSSINLTNEQKKIIILSLTNGNWENKVHKINVYWFLRFLEMTHGNWIPKSQNFEKSKLDILNGIFNVSYSARTMFEFLTWCSNYCLELGLIERIKSTTVYDQIFLTPLGTEITNIFSLDLTLKKSRMNLNLHVYK